jgi:hypothetical protein
MIRFVCYTVFACILLQCQSLLAQIATMQASPFFEHPVTHPVETRTAAKWRNGVGGWGENLADKTLRMRGFNEIREIKHGSNNGVDRIAVKRGPDGAIRDVRFVEVKTTRSSKPKLGKTQYGGKQMSPLWLSKNFRLMRKSPDPEVKKLALEISRYRKAKALPISSMGEVMHVNARTGVLTGYASDGRTVKYSQSIERLLKNIQSRAGSASSRNWASRSLAEWDRIRATNMSQYLGKTSIQQSKLAILAHQQRGGPQSKSISRSAILRTENSRHASTLIKRSAGRAAVLLAFATDAKELFDVEYAYRKGTISIRQRNTQLASTVGGMGGAFVGATGGAISGTWVGAFGGPFAWATVPVGGFVGGAIGGVGGYFGGSIVASYGANQWYDSIDASVREKFELSLLKSIGSVQ